MMGDGIRETGPAMRGEETRLASRERDDRRERERDQAHKRRGEEAARKAKEADVTSRNLTRSNSKLAEEVDVDVFQREKRRDSVLLRPPPTAHRKSDSASNQTTKRTSTSTSTSTTKRTRTRSRIGG
ncbi:hypothetical protein Hte_005858 [Hypoxylon texense]